MCSQRRAQALAKMAKSVLDTQRNALRAVMKRIGSMGQPSTRTHIHTHTNRHAGIRTNR